MAHYDNEREAELNEEEWPRLMLGDCLERMKEIESGSVDMILADVPYGTTVCKWDSIIPLGPMWKQLKRVIKPNGAICYDSKSAVYKYFGRLKCARLTVFLGMGKDCSDRS